MHRDVVKCSCASGCCTISSGQGRRWRNRLNIINQMNNLLKSASTVAERNKAQWTRWRFIEGFGGYLPGAVSLPWSAGTKYQRNLVDKSLCMIHL